MLDISSPFELLHCRYPYLYQSVEHFIFDLMSSSFPLNCMLAEYVSILTLAIFLLFADFSTDGGDCKA
jgi:hypothetical protein